ncbi:peptidase U32 family protein [Cohnella sp. JJ-181]|uniref:peptidase U32 family protein n=1 Tax=Cohnella rhizoplanae TaxID=2974897 RepID=UPI0022FFBE90|nr:peptidase U32 family protein [Cohnella sp. JJ-181]CAI6015284.1 putative protease YhbU [Cohnella sp. JJ-181]
MTTELLIAAGSIDQIRSYAGAGANAVLIGDSRFGARLPGSIAEADLKEAVACAHDLGARAYIAAGKLLRNHELPALPGYLRAAAEAGADAVTFGDPAVWMAVRDAAPAMAMHWNVEMTGTNSAAAAFWSRRGVSRAVLARELNGEEIADFKRSGTIEVQVQVHGMTNIYHSQRNLLQSYMDYLGREASLVDLGPSEGRFLIEAERPDERLPVYEDDNGTHVMSADDICLLEALPELLEAGVDSLYIEPLLKSEAYNVAAIRSYRRAIDAWHRDPGAYEFDEEWLAPIRALQDPGRELSFGFLYKEQVY